MPPPLFLFQYVRIGGYVLLAIGFAMLAVTANHLWQGVPVTVKAHVRGVVGENSFKVRFETVPGEQEHRTYRLFYEISPAPHFNGQIIPGKIDKLTGRMLSEKLIFHEIYMSFLVLVFGVFALFIIAPAERYGLQLPGFYLTWGRSDKSRETDDDSD